MKSILFVMSLSGTTMFILQMIVNLILKEVMSEKSKYFLLKLSIFFYLIPLPLIKNYYMDLFDIFGYNIFSLSHKEVYNTDIIVSFETESFNFSYTFTILTVLLTIIYLIIMVLIVWHIISYFILKSKINNYSEKIYDKDIISILDKEKKILKLKRNVTIRSSKYIEVPMTTGFFCPVILLPQKEISKESLMWIFKHELAHIHNYDYIYRLLCIAVIAIHWFNPFVYLLYRQLCVFSEFNCDKFVVKGLNQEQCIKYGNTILEFSSIKNGVPLYKVVNMLGSYNKNIMKARLKIVKYSNKKRKNKSIIQAIIITSTIFISSLTVFAYKEPEISPENINYITNNLEDVSSYSVFGKVEKTNIKLPDLQDAGDVSHYFIDENGVTYKIDENKEKVICNHNYVDGNYVVHTKKGNGCVVEYYNAQKCTKCGSVILGEKYGTGTFDVCPH